jgi:hypothetical protein
MWEQDEIEDLGLVSSFRDNGAADGSALSILSEASDHNDAGRGEGVTMTTCDGTFCGKATAGHEGHNVRVPRLKKPSSNLEMSFQLQAAKEARVALSRDKTYKQSLVVIGCNTDAGRNSWLQVQGAKSETSKVQILDADASRPRPDRPYNTGQGDNKHSAFSSGWALDERNLFVLAHCTSSAATGSGNMESAGACRWVGGCWVSAD